MAIIPGPQILQGSQGKSRNVGSITVTDCVTGKAVRHEVTVTGMCGVRARCSGIAKAAPLATVHASQKADM